MLREKGGTKGTIRGLLMGELSIGDVKGEREGGQTKKRNKMKNKKFIIFIVLACVFAASAFVVVGLILGLSLPSIVAKIFSALFFAFVGVLCLLAFISILNNRDE